MLWSEGGRVSSGDALDDFHVDAEGGGVLDEVLAVAAVDPDLADRVKGGGDLVERNLSSWRGHTVRIVDDTERSSAPTTSEIPASTT